MDLIYYAMGKERISYLLQQYSSGRATKEEVEEMFGLMRSEESSALLKDLILDKHNDEEEEISLPSRNWDRMWHAVRSVTNLPARKKVFSLGWGRVAAAVLIVVMSGVAYRILHKTNVNKTISQVHYSNDILPGSNKAILTLANGATIVLDSVHNGLIGRQGNTSIVKVDAGALAYDTRSKHEGEILYNAISTPRGGQYQVILPDGSKVWLNAASSLRFPTSFVGKERLVELTGEAYFEIAKNRAMPFRVYVVPPLGSGREGMNVQVLGTHFNIKAYENEQSIRTTLLEGAVKVKFSGPEVQLQPGRQAIADNGANMLRVVDANTEQVVAWKNGLFRFKETSIRELMREVERWYNVEVVYNTEKTDQDFTGIVPRTQNISALLNTLELTGTVHFKIEGRKIIVLP
ncbi:MAG TPA: FecR domain-containing protein [Puia sp.]|nr:FecR domain-containing protein [Puia sp.]